MPVKPSSTLSKKYRISGSLNVLAHGDGGITWSAYNIELLFSEIQVASIKSITRRDSLFVPTSFLLGPRRCVNQFQLFSLNFHAISEK